jgi:hypothetical protein
MTTFTMRRVGGDFVVTGPDPGRPALAMGPGRLEKFCPDTGIKPFKSEYLLRSAR